MIGVEVCERCGFVRDEWDEQDARRTLDHAELLLELWSDGATGHLDDKLAARRTDDLKAIAASADLHDRVHHLMHGLVSIADVRRAAGDAVARQVGTVAAVNVSSGGVPKLPIERAEVGRRGLAGDVQAARVHHGRPWQAVCLWSSEVIDAFAAEGHPIAAGNAGENLTISGLEWASLRAGTIIELGADPASTVRLQLSAPAVPCSKNAGWFGDGDFSRMSHDLHPGNSRWYASVLRVGSVAAGDRVVVSPA